MDLLQIFVLAVVQGLTEFLPISSSAHLILVPKLTGWPDQGLAFDVAVHVGTLSAVVLYFREEILHMFKAWTGSLSGRGLNADARLAWAVLLGTIPVGLAGLFFDGIIEKDFRSPKVIAVASIVFGLYLLAADIWGRRQRSEQQITWLDTLMIGVSQAIALIPGTSRSGITMATGLAMGLTRQAAARFSFLLSIPVIVLAGGLEVMKLLESSGPVDWTALLLGSVLSGISAYLCIHFFLKLLDRIGMLPFVIYRVLLGMLLLVIFV
jgi:undecaprenyl-diphosphatase